MMPLRAAADEVQFWGRAYSHPVAARASDGTDTCAEPRAAGSSGLGAILETARLRVLRATILISLLIALSNLVGAIAGFTVSGAVTGPAITLGAGWCVLWLLAATWPELTTRAFVRWRLTALVLGSANAATIALTGGIDSPLPTVCVYVGWIGAVVVPTRPALVMSLVISASVLAGYMLAGASVADILTGTYRYGAVTNAVLPLLAGMIGALLTNVTNSVFSGLAPTTDGLRGGMPATTPGLTALLAGRPVLEPPAFVSDSEPAPPGRPDRRLTDAEREVVRLLAKGYTPKQIARLRKVKESTVRSQVKSAKRKTGARTLAQLALHAES